LKSFRKFCGFRDGYVTGGFSSRVGCTRILAGPDGEFPKTLNDLKERLAFLLSDYLSEDESQGTDITPQGFFFEFRGKPQQFPKTFSLILDPPEGYVVRHELL
jgi:hypothetical protein